MFNSVVFNVVIGLVFIYLLYSLLATIIQEFFAACFGMRSRMLKKGICRMLDDEENVNELLSESFYGHPLIKYLGECKLFSKPSYLSAQNFSKVLIDLLRGESIKPGQNFVPFIQKALDDGRIAWGDAKINPETLAYLKSLWADAQGDIEKYKSLLEQWFDDTMERVSGWYKRRSQLILFCIGLFLAVSFNVDTISIADKLSHNPKLASQLADNASKYMQTHEELGNRLRVNAAKQADTTEAKNSINAYLDSISEYMVIQSNKLIDSANVMINTDIANANELLGLGWKCAGSKENDKTCISISDNFHWWSIIGWLITGLAISLGAPFWFDLLNKIIKIRNSGKKPDEPATLITNNSEKSSVKRAG
jgi:hypothetical protein